MCSYRLTVPIFHMAELSSGHQNFHINFDEIAVTGQSKYANFVEL